VLDRNPDNSLLLSSASTTPVIFQGRENAFGVIQSLNGSGQLPLQVFYGLGARTVLAASDPANLVRSACTLDPNPFGIQATPKTLLTIGADLEPLLAEIQTRKPDIVALCALYGSVQRVVQAAQQRGINAKIWIGASLFSDPRFRSDPLLSHSFLYDMVGWEPSKNNVSSAFDADSSCLDYSPFGCMSSFAFAHLYNSSYGIVPATEVAATFAALEVMVQSIAGAQSKDPVTVRRFIAANRFDTVYGTIAFGRHSKQNKAPTVLRQLQGSPDNIRILAPADIATGGPMYPSPTWQRQACWARRDCGRHGVCEDDGSCRCAFGWTGAHCNGAAGIVLLALAGLLAAVAFLLAILMVLRQRRERRRAAEAAAADKEAATKRVHTRTLAYATHSLLNPLLAVTLAAEEMKAAGVGARLEPSAAPAAPASDPAPEARTAAGAEAGAGVGAGAVASPRSAPQQRSSAFAAARANRESLRTIRRAARQMQRVIADMAVGSTATEQLLALESAEADREVVSLPAVLRDLRHRMENLHAVSVATSVAPGVPEHVLTDALRFQQVLSHSLAILHVSAAGCECARLQLLVTAVDAGVGGGSEAAAVGINDATPASEGVASPRTAAAAAQPRGPAADLPSNASSPAGGSPLAFSRTQAAAAAAAQRAGAAAEAPALSGTEAVAVAVSTRAAARVVAQGGDAGQARPVVAMRSESGALLSGRPMLLTFKGSCRQAGGLDALTASGSIAHSVSVRNAAAPSAVSASAAVAHAAAPHAQGNAVDGSDAEVSAVHSERAGSGAAAASPAVVSPWRTAKGLLGSAFGRLRSARRTSDARQPTEDAAAAEPRRQADTERSEGSALQRAVQSGLRAVSRGTASSEAAVGRLTAFVGSTGGRQAAETRPDRFAWVMGEDTCRRLAQSLGGSLLFEASPDCSSFTLVIPVQPAAPMHVASPDSAPGLLSSSRVRSASLSAASVASVDRLDVRGSASSRSVGSAHGFLQSLSMRGRRGSGGNSPNHGHFRASSQPEFRGTEAPQLLPASVNATMRATRLGNPNNSISQLQMVPLRHAQGVLTPGVSGQAPTRILPASDAVGARTASAADGRRFNLHVLVVDDEVVNVRLVQRMLQRQGCSTQALYDGADIGQLPGLGVHAADLVLLDIVMPRSNGVQVGKEILAQGFRGTLVAMTANTSPDDVAAYKSAGFHEVLGKPFTSEAIAALLGRVAAAKQHAGAVSATSSTPSASPSSAQTLLDPTAGVLTPPQPASSVAVAVSADPQAR
jgi:CheY-like chemotaxis protein